ncbi:MAG: YhgE/Pip domain-containing protein, partial [Clostridia bacterium]|nr:YhgE/Pip domain-containing protein [Clostridia bacterium]
MRSKFQAVRKYAVIIAVILIPLVYSFFYLDAFWDPYSKLDQMPVAVVNEDTGASINGVNRNLGQEITDELKNDQQLKWVITTPEEAKAGVTGRKYYAEILITKDFSKNIASAEKTDKVQGIIVYQPNEKRNFLASQVLNRVMLEFKDTISRKVTKEIVSQLTLEVTDLPDQLQKLEDGLAKLEDGTKAFQEGAEALADGQARFGAGVDQLSGGIHSAKAGSNALTEGSSRISSGLAAFNQKLTDGAQSAEALKSGSTLVDNSLTTLSDGMSQFAEGVDKLNQGATGLTSGTASFNTKLGEFSQGLDKLFSAIKTSSATNKQVSDYLSAYLKNHPEAMQDPNISAILTLSSQSAASMSTLPQTLDTLQKASQALTAGAGQLKAGVDSVSTNLALLNDKAKLLAQGSQQLDAKYSLLNSGIVKMSQSLIEAGKNAALLAKGSEDLNTGLQTLDQGLSKLSAGASELSLSSKALSDGSNKLKEAATQINSGAGTAREEVHNAVTKANDKMAALDGLDTFASEPVTLQEQKVYGVPDYGTAFSPYFISLSLWVGALLIFYVIYLDPTVRFREGKRTKNIAKYLGYSMLGVVQAIVLGSVIRVGLHLNVQSVFDYYLTCILVALSFIAIMQFLICLLYTSDA